MRKTLIKIFPYLNVMFLLATLTFQIFFFKLFFLNTGFNGDEKAYFTQVSEGFFSASYISGSLSQPYTFLAGLLHLGIADAMLCNRLISLLSCVFLLIFLFRYFKKYKFSEFISVHPFWNNLALFNILLALVTVIRGHLVGTPDMLSVSFAVPAFLLLIESIRNGKNGKGLVIGLLFALSFTARPTFLVVLLAFMAAVLIVYRKLIFSRVVILTGIYFCLFTALINFYPLLENGKIIIDDKEPSETSGTSWFEMNYLMAKKWDAGEIPRTKWLSQYDVQQYKKDHPDFIFPKNHLDLIMSEPGLFFRQMLRMGIISLYSSFRFLYLLFPFLLIFAFRKHMRRSQEDKRIALFVLCFYFAALFLFMFMRIKLMEFRWMHILLIYYGFYSLDLTRNISEKQRLVLFNGSFIIGILFCIAAFLRGV